MIIPIPEILHNENHYQFKASYENALEYQLKKVVFLTQQVEAGLDNQEKDSRFYVADQTFVYTLDTLINNLSTLTEYYYAWILFSHIGTITHEKARYSPIQRGSQVDAAIDKIFAKHDIGRLERSSIASDDYREQCRRAFLSAYDFLFVGKFHELFTLNNYLKHNMISSHYAPKAILGDRQISVPYVYIRKPDDLLLNTSVLKLLFSIELNEDGKTQHDTENYFIEIINRTSRQLGQLGGLKVFNINGIDYLQGEAMVGMSIESMVELSHDLLRNIMRVFSASSQGNMTREQLLGHLSEQICLRAPRTLNQLTH